MYGGRSRGRLGEEAEEKTRLSHLVVSSSVNDQPSKHFLDSLTLSNKSAYIEELFVLGHEDGVGVEVEADDVRRRLKQIEVSRIHSHDERQRSEKNVR